MERFLPFWPRSLTHYDGKAHTAPPAPRSGQREGDGQGDPSPLRWERGPGAAGPATAPQLWPLSHSRRWQNGGAALAPPAPSSCPAATRSPPRRGGAYPFAPPLTPPPGPGWAGRRAEGGARAPAPCSCRKWGGRRAAAAAMSFLIDSSIMVTSQVPCCCAAPSPALEG